MSDDRWRASAACRNRTAAMFDNTRLKQARTVCDGCPVEQVCLWANLRDEVSGDRYGMAGGMTAGQRAVAAERLSPTVIEAAYEAALVAWETINAVGPFQTTEPLRPMTGPTPAPTSPGTPTTSSDVAEPVTASRRVVAAVAAAFRLRPEQLCGPSRVRHVVEARQVAMYVLREAEGLSYPGIGAVIGRDHTTVMHAVARVRARLDESPALRRGVAGLVAAARSGADPSGEMEYLGGVAAPAVVADTKAVVEEAARVCEVRPEQLCGRSRTRPVAEARHIAMYVLREAQGLSYPVIGAAVGGRDHSTAMHGVERVRQAILQPGLLRERVERVLAAATPTSTPAAAAA